MDGLPGPVSVQVLHVPRPPPPRLAAAQVRAPAPPAVRQRMKTSDCREAGDVSRAALPHAYRDRMVAPHCAERVRRHPQCVRRSPTQSAKRVASEHQPRGQDRPPAIRDLPQRFIFRSPGDLGVPEKWKISTEIPTAVAERWLGIRQRGGLTATTAWSCASPRLHRERDRKQAANGRRPGPLPIRRVRPKG